MKTIRNYYRLFDIYSNYIFNFDFDFKINFETLDTSAFTSILVLFSMSAILGHGAFPFRLPTGSTQYLTSPPWGKQLCDHLSSKWSSSICSSVRPCILGGRVIPCLANVSSSIKIKSYIYIMALNLRSANFLNVSIIL